MEIRFFHEDVQAFIASLEKPTIVKITRLLELLSIFKRDLGMPQSRRVGKGIFELRIHGKQEVRLCYAYKNGTAFILSGFIKKTHKTPTQELMKAIQRKKYLDEL